MLKYLIAAIVLVALDGVYLNLIKGHFNSQIKAVQGSDISVNYIGAGLTYVILIFAINYFIIQRNRSPIDAAYLGFCIYGVYELTNYALLKNWSLTTVFIDTLWGTLLFFITAFVVNKITSL